MSIMKNIVGINIEDISLKIAVQKNLKLQIFPPNGTVLKTKN